MQVIGHLVHCNNNLHIITLVLFLFSGINAQEYPDKSVHNIIKHGITLIINQEYDDAKKIFDQLDRTRKDLPLGKIYLAAVSIAKSYDYEEPFDDKQITKYLESAKKISQRLMNKDEKNVWNNYFLALTDGYIAYYAALRESWLQAFSSGLSSVSVFEGCLKIDKNFYEAMIAIGSYKYWKSKKIEFISWLPFIDDEKEIGIINLKNAVKYSGYNSHLAIHSLIWIYIDQEKYDEAIKVAETALKDHPRSRIFKWGLARSLEGTDPQKSAKLYQEILDSYPKNLKTNNINQVTLKHLIAQQLVKINKFQEALVLCNEILLLKDYKVYELDKINGRLERVRQLKQDLIRR